MTRPLFSNRYGLIVALIGMAVGTGNIWRFPRVMAQNGGGAFFIPWFLFLFLWSVPLLIVEFSIGQKLRRSVVGSFAQLSGGRLTWMGGFIVLCTLGIMFYYSVVTGWCLYYMLQSLSGGIFATDSQLLWKRFSAHSPYPFYAHLICIALIMAVAVRGVEKGIERLNRWMIPVMTFILAALAFYTVSLPGKEAGLSFVFNTDFSKLLNYRVWLEALTQSAWSTGAGWGLALTYAGYTRRQENPVLTSFTTGLGNNSIELIAAFVIMPALFSFFPLAEVLKLAQSGNTGLTFIALPGLFEQVPAGRLLAISFFSALFFAAFTSLLAMFEMGISFLADLGFGRRHAILFLGLIHAGAGTFSALNPSFLDNQDWVWGVGLLINGFFYAYLMRHIGIETFYRDFMPLKAGLHRFVFEKIIFLLIPLEFAALLMWWFFQSAAWDPERWWHPFSGLSVGTCLFQWGIVISLLLLVNRPLAEYLEKRRS